ncbi:MAG: DUF5050 domain-containing protein [Verrucomicrobia bacterium]|nr:DUF5050 domain-containing protein [Verrucomicrobiota bacterium]
MRFAAALIITTGSLFLWFNACQPVALHVWGVETQAQVYSASAISARRSTAFAQYEFTTTDKTLAHGSYLGTRNAPGHSVRILYLPFNPAVNGPAGFGYGATQVGFLGLLGWLLSLWAVRVALPKSARSNARRKKTVAAPAASGGASPETGADDATASGGQRRPAFGLSLLLSGCIVAAVLAYLRLAGGNAVAESGATAAPAGLTGAVSRGSTAANAANGNLFGFDGEWLYFGRWPNRQDPAAPVAGLYRCKLPDGSAPSLVGPPGATAKIFQGISVQGGWVYYVAMEGLCRIRTDGTGHRTLIEQPINAACVVGDWIYYQRTHDRNRLWRMKLDGGAQTRLTEEEAGCFSVADDGFVYYANKTDGEAIYRMRWDGAGRTKLTDRTTRVLLAEAGALWFVDAKTEQLCRLSLADQSCQTIVATPVSSMSVVDGRVYFTNEEQVKRCNLDGSEPASVCPAKDLLKFCVHGGRIYFGSWDGTGPIRSVGLDGALPHSIAR